jgi:hypothetical protein
MLVKENSVTRALLLRVEENIASIAVDGKEKNMLRL